VQPPEAGVHNRPVADVSESLGLNICKAAFLSIKPLQVKIFSETDKGRSYEAMRVPKIEASMRCLYPTDVMRM
jgi:hypothetical protein